MSLIKFHLLTDFDESTPGIRVGRDGAGQIVRARRSRILAVLAAIGVCLCGVTGAAADSAARDLAGAVPTFLASQTAPAVRTVIGQVEGYGCGAQRDRPLDVSIQQSEALDQLRVRALKAGANGVVNVTFEPIHTDHRNQCFQGLAARGQAVVFNTP